MSSTGHVVQQHGPGQSTSCVTSEALVRSFRGGTQQPHQQLQHQQLQHQQLQQQQLQLQQQQQQQILQQQQHPLPMQQKVPVQTKQSPPTSIQQVRPPIVQQDARQDALLQELAWKCPNSYISERVRFLKGHQAKASETLRTYIDWRSRWQKQREYMFGQQLQQQLTYDSAYDRDRADWNEWNIAVEVAKRIAWEDNASASTDTGSVNTYNPQYGVTIPRCIQSYARLDYDMEWTDRYGHRVIVFRPGQMDDQLMPLSTYALAIAIYVDSKLRRDSYERVTVLIDVRAGVGWKNIPASQMIVQQPSFIREISKALLSLLPERLYMSIMFPVPVTLRWMWSGASQFLEPITAKKFCLLTGPAASNSPQPTDQLKKYFDDAFVSLLEQDRINNFIYV